MSTYSLMNPPSPFHLPVLAALGLITALAPIPNARAGLTDATLNHQGRVSVQGVNFTGTGQFKFALIGPAENTSVQATAVPVIGGAGDGLGPRVLSITLSNAGSGYLVAPQVIIEHPTASGATAHAVLTATGEISEIIVDTDGVGQGYDHQTTVSVGPPPPNFVIPTFWSNDGTSTTGEAPEAAVSIPVTNGLYSIQLGGTAPGMSRFDTEIFANPLSLRIWFSDGTNGFQLLSPDQPLGSAATAIRALVAETLPPASVTSGHLAENAVTAGKIAPGTIGATHIANASLTALSLDTGLTAPAAGQVLSFTNDGLRWVNSASGLSLPYASGQVSAGFNQSIFRIECITPNLGTAIEGLSVNGPGLKGSSTNARGVSGSSAGSDGIYGETSSPTSSGVRGSVFSGAAGASGVHGSASGDSTGVLAQHVLGNGLALKVQGRSNLDGQIVNDWIEIKGNLGQRAYIGADSNNDIEVGSLNGDLSLIAFYNRGSNQFMNIRARNATVETLTITGGADLAEPFAMSSHDVEPGSVVVIDEENPGKLKLSGEAYDKKVAGIVSGADGIQPGISMLQEDMLEAGKNVALSGRVYVKANNSAGDIEPGDLLTTSPIPGEAMKASDHDRAQGAILGKAMTGLKERTGKVLVLVTLQ